MTSSKGHYIQVTEGGSTNELLPSVHFFNPGYEATLQNSRTHYTPTASVQQFRRDCTLLPLYLPEATEAIVFSNEGKSIISLSGEKRPFSSRICINPWGWAPELKGLFPEVRLPYSFEEMKFFGSRLRSVDLWNKVYSLSPKSFEAEIIAPRIIARGDDIPEEKCVIKSEFSSSGRGVQFAKDTNQAKAIIQKSLGRGDDNRVILEPWLDKSSDRGYEFHRALDGSVTYLGGSDFQTEKGRYIGNRLVSAQALEQEWEKVQTNPSHRDYVELLTQALSELDLGSYDGLLGVDTMVYKGEDERLYISPCIELNVRPTMGHLALELSKRYLSDGQSGYFQIALHPNTLSLISEEPLFLRKEKLTPGHYPLVPLTDQTLFVPVLTIYPL